MDEQRPRIDFVEHFLGWIIGLLTCLFSSVMSMFGFNNGKTRDLSMDEAECLQGIEDAIEAHNNRRALQLFSQLVGTNDVYLIRNGLSKLIAEAPRFAHQFDFAGALNRAIPQSNYKQKCFDIIFNLPQFFKTYDILMINVAKRVACVVIAPDRAAFEAHKQELADFLFHYPYSIVTDVLDNYITIDQRMEVLVYIEKYLEPKWTDVQMRASNDMYSVMAKKVRRSNYNTFMSAVLASNNFSYHGLMAALTEHAQSGLMTKESALCFIQEKHDSCSHNEAIGYVSNHLQDTIEIQFILAILKDLNVYDIEKVMRCLDSNRFMSREVLAEIAKNHIQELDLVLHMQPFNHSLIYLSRQSALTKYCKKYKNEVLENTLKFANDTLYMMNATQHRVLCSILSSQCWPKEECKLVGNDKLFGFLFTRLMHLLPPMDSNRLELEFQSYQNTLYCIQSLFTIDESRKRMMSSIDPYWANKISHAADLHLITSGNLEYDMNRINNPVIKEDLRRQLFIVNSTGQQLFYILGMLPDKRLLLDLPCMSFAPWFKEDTFTSTFTKRLFIELTNTRKKPSLRVFLPHRSSPEVLRWVVVVNQDFGSESGNDGDPPNGNDSGNDSGGEDAGEDSGDDSDATSVYSEYTIGSSSDSEDYSSEEEDPYSEQYDDIYTIRGGDAARADFTSSSENFDNVNENNIHSSSIFLSPTDELNED